MNEIRIILDSTDLSSPTTLFVEIENAQGQSICIGDHRERADGLREIRITAEDIVNLSSVRKG